MNVLEISQQHKQLIAKVKEKLKEGKDGIYTADHLPEMRHVGLKQALTGYHGALEDYFRASLVTKVPMSERETVLDHKTTEWKDLLQLGKKYLGLSQSDADLISEANYYRNEESAHGDKLTWQEAKVRQYVKFVERWCQKDIELLDDQETYSSAETGSSATTGYKSKSDTEPYKPKPPTQVYKPTPSTYVVSEPTPWYRSIWFLWLMFIFVNPIWALLIITEKDGNGCLKVVAWFLLIYYIVFFFVYIYLRDQYLSQESMMNPQESTSFSYTKTIASDYGTTYSQNTPELTTTPNVSLGTCEIIWEEYQESDLSNKNRSMVWDEIVYQRVRGSGMTARIFFDLVVDQNSSLAADGYVFKQGKIYLLPRCK